MDSVGELTFDRTRIERRASELNQILSDISDAGDDGELGPTARERVAVLERTLGGLIDDIRALRRTERSLQEGLTGVRMQVAKVLFSRLAPQLRAMGRSAGKRVNLTTSGDETEFDKSLADKLFDPILQLLRNAVAHGVESAAERRALKKPAVASIHLGARQEGSSIVIEVSDDGPGIDTDALSEATPRLRSMVE